MAKYDSVVLALVLCLAVGGTRAADLLDEITLQIEGFVDQIAGNYPSNAEPFHHPDYDLTTIELVNKYGYKGDIHTVTTHDGYILELHRVNKRDNVTHKPLILIMHAILSSSSDYVIAGPKRGLAYLLADEGYDVWLANARGNRYSRNHTYLDIESRTFWNFSFHDIGLYDVPALIDYILEVTGMTQMCYIGHSQGSAAFSVMMSEMPSYNKKIRAAFFMAPVAHLEYMSSPVFQALSHIAEYVAWWMDLLGEYRFEPTGTLMKQLKSLVCDPISITQPICTTIIFTICGYSESQMDHELLPLIMNHVPAGASTKQFRHFAQVYLSGKFQKFDNGFFGNLLTYKSPVPPMYNLSKIEVDTHLFYSEIDLLATAKDVERIAREIPNSRKHLVPELNHLDFLWGKDVQKLLYNDMIRTIATYL